MSPELERHLLEGLELLRAVVDAGSFSGAAERVGISQPAVSRAVARLEARVGVRMFRRTARSIALTDEGRRFYESVAPHLIAIEEATADARDSKARIRGRLRVNVDPGTAQVVLVPRLTAFLEEHPELVVELIACDRLGDLVREGFDLAVRVGRLEPSALKARLLARARVVTVASPVYLARHGAPHRPSDVERHRCVLFRDPSSGRHFGWDFIRGRKTVSVNVGGPMMVNQFGMMLAACIAGQGIAQVLDFHAREPLADGRLVQVLPEWADETYPLYAYQHAAPLVSARVRAFLDFVTNATRAAASRLEMHEPG
jgi:DNA-binding transcriptional LysR family regulator